MSTRWKQKPNLCPCDTALLAALHSVIITDRQETLRSSALNARFDIEAGQRNRKSRMSCCDFQLESQHSKGGLTSLLASFGALLQPATPDSIREAFARVSVKDMRNWVTKNLGSTVASKRQSAFAECKAPVSQLTT